jgi:hypothetical protein
MTGKNPDPAKVFLSATQAAIKQNKTADPTKAVTYWGQKQLSQPSRPAQVVKKPLK